MTPTELFQIQVLFFGATADATGERSAQLDLPAGATAADALTSLTSNYPALASHKLLYAVNEEYVPGGEPLRPGDMLAVFTPVSGG